MRQTLNRFKWYLVIFGVFFLFFACMYYGARRGRSLRNNLAYCYGTINEVHSGAGGTGSWYYTEYDYILKGKHYSGSSSYQASVLRMSEWRRFFIGRKILIEYDSTNFSNSLGIILPQDYEIRGLKFPDSLKWINKYLDD